jgi:hypothetical protein
VSGVRRNLGNIIAPLYFHWECQTLLRDDVSGDYPVQVTQIYISHITTA